ncbi:conserved hypothetical protein [Candidatus Roizmanbacteria bacterium]|nr:conserved hypothetical protein [Candidatus Roizmanbacteria bacterium]
MARVSKFKLRDDVLEKLFGMFFETIGNRDDKKQFTKIINGVFSQNERIVFAKRIGIVYLLLKNIDLHNICMALNVSTGTVAKFKLLIENNHEGLNEAFEEIILRDKTREAIDDFFSLIFRPGKYGVNWELAWERKRESERKKRFGI